MKAIKISNSPQYWGYITDKVSSNHLDGILKEFDMQTHKRYNRALAGYIEDEFQLKDQDPSFLEYLELLATELHTNIHGTTNDDFELDDIWVNFQKVGEFNPVHSHSGAYSFVIWYDIPFTLEEEAAAAKIFAHTTEISGQFYFMYPENNQIGFVYPGIDSSWNGQIAIFPSTLMHGVHPFRSNDGTRITIAGNMVRSNKQ